MPTKDILPEQNERIVTFPWMGHDYTLLLKESLEDLGIKVVLPPLISEHTVKLGVRHSSDMMCFPFKVTLGSLIEALDKGANTLIAYDNCGQCRQRHYWKIYEFTLKNLGYKFELYPISRATAIPVLKKISNKSTFAAIKACKKFFREVKEHDDKKYKWSSEKLNIGIIGEIYTCCEEKINYNIERKLRDLGVNPFNTANLSGFLKTDSKISFSNVISLIMPARNQTDTIFIEKEWFDNSEKRKYKKLAKEYLNGPVGGHGFENIYNLLWMKDKNVDGIIHLLPLSCMPETTIEPFINEICQKSDIPMLRLPIDDTNSEANVDTRIETFVELIKRKRGRQNEMLVGN